MHEKGSLMQFTLRHQKAVELVETIKMEISAIEDLVRRKVVAEEIERLSSENAKLKQELKDWQDKVVNLEVQRGIKQVPLPSGNVLASSEVKDMPSGAKKSKPDPELASAEKQNKPAKKDKEAKKKEKSKAPAAEVAKEENKDINVSRLDLRVGRIVSVEKHPDADTLYVEKVDLGEQQPRTVVSGLVKFVPIEKMRDRLVIVLCNLKPVKMRGILSEAMVMCASTPDKVEVLNPPTGSVPGDPVSCEDFLGNPDSLLNPKKKIFEQVAPDLKTNSECIATYKGSPLVVLGKGVIRSETLSGVQIK